MGRNRCVGEREEIKAATGMFRKERLSRGGFNISVSYGSRVEETTRGCPSIWFNWQGASQRRPSLFISYTSSSPHLPFVGAIYFLHNSSCYILAAATQQSQAPRTSENKFLMWGLSRVKQLLSTTEASRSKNAEHGSKHLSNESLEWITAP